MAQSIIRGDWWSDDLSRHDAIGDLVKVISEEQGARRKSNLMAMRLYGGADYQGLHGNQYAKTVNGEHLALNVIRAVASTATSKIAKMKPRVVALTDGGNWSQRQRAQRLTKFMDGAFYGTEIYEVGQRAFLDACIFSEGIVKLFAEDGKIKVERVFPNEIIVDDAEAINGEPRSMHRVREVAREVVIAKWPEYERKIADVAVGSTMQVYRGGSYHADMIQVTESWHLPSGKGTGDGRYSVTLPTVTLEDTEYKHDYFPFEVIRWDLMPLGWHGQGLAQQLFRLQYEINMLLQSIEASMRLSRPYFLAEREAHLNEAQLTNELWRVVEYDRGANAPTPITPPIVHPQVIDQLDRLYQRAFEITGISQMSAQSQKPAGLNSGKALREFNDIESERFQMVSQRYENFYLKCANHIIDIAKELSEEKDYTVAEPGNSGVELIRWSDVDMERDAFVMKLMPTSFLPTTPAGRLATIEDMMQAGLLDKSNALALLDYPDIEGIAGGQNAALKNIDRKIENMLDAENPIREMPEPFDDMALARVRVVNAYNQALLDGAPEENLDLLRRYISDIEAREKKAAEESASVGAMQQQQMAQQAQEGIT